MLACSPLFSLYVCMSHIYSSFRIQEIKPEAGVLATVGKGIDIYAMLTRAERVAKVGQK